MRLAICVLLGHTAAAIDQGTILLRVDGKDVEYHVSSLDESAGTTEVTTRGIVLQHGNLSNQGTRIWITNDGGLSPDSYVHFPLLGKRLSYDLDLSNAPCSCNAALFWVSMPGFDAQGQPAPGEKGNFYCDGNKVWGNWCWEFDSVEANQYVMQTTAHECSSEAGAFISSCDRAGARRNSYFANRKGMCPEDSCLIDTRRPFHHEQSFVVGESGDTLLRIENRLEQDGRVFEFNGTENAAYLARMSGAMNSGMVLTFQMWGGNWFLMCWLDFPSCFGSCPWSSSVGYYNISLSDIPKSSFQTKLVTV